MALKRQLEGLGGVLWPNASLSCLWPLYISGTGTIQTVSHLTNCKQPRSTLLWQLQSVSRQHRDTRGLVDTAHTLPWVQCVHQGSYIPQLSIAAKYLYGIHNACIHFPLLSVCILLRSCDNCMRLSCANLNTVSYLVC